MCTLLIASLVTMGRGRGRPKYKGHSRHFTSREELEEERKKEEEKQRKVYRTVYVLSPTFLSHIHYNFCCTVEEVTIGFK